MTASSHTQFGALIIFYISTQPKVYTTDKKIIILFSSRVRRRAAACMLNLAPLILYSFPCGGFLHTHTHTLRGWGGRICNCWGLHEKSSYSYMSRARDLIDGSIDLGVTRSTRRAHDTLQPTSYRQQSREYINQSSAHWKCIDIRTPQRATEVIKFPSNAIRIIVHWLPTLVEYVC